LELEEMNMSWILTCKSDGEVIGEFYDRRMVDRFNPSKVLIETAGEYLGRINAAIAKAQGQEGKP
jgi:hypothetical protein